MRIKLEYIYANLDNQTRTQLDPENVERLIQAFKNKNNTVPPILVKKRDKHHYDLYDGFHRYEAAKQLGISSLDAELFKGDDKAALQEGVRRNMTHGLQLIREDMRKAARMLYVKYTGGESKGDRKGSSTELAELFGVSIQTILRWCNDSLREKSKKENQFKAHAAKIVKEHADEGIREAVLEQFGVKALSQEYEPAVKWSFSSKAKHGPGVPMLMLSDIHYGEMVDPEQVFNTNKFNREICKKRLEHTFTKAAELLLGHFAKPDYPGIVLILGGDMISGSLHEDSAITDEVAPLVQAMEVAKIIADGVAFLKTHFKNVDVYCVPGNHGRTTRRPYAKFYAHNNLDWLAYRMLADYIGNINVTVNAPNARDLTFEVANHKYRLTHGDQFRGGDGVIGALGPIIRGDVRKRVAASLMPGQPESYDTLICGHFHTLIQLPRVIVNGSVKGYDEFALSNNFAWEPPAQALWTVHPTHGQTWYAPVMCDPEYVAHGRHL